MEQGKKAERLSLLGGADIDAAVEYAAAIMRAGGVVLTPTDTVYGLISMPTEEAMREIFRMKERPYSRHLPIIVADRSQAERELPLCWTSAADALAAAFWPGALTLACGIRENDLPWLAGRVEAGVRAPDYPFIQKLARKLGALVMTSANRHGVPTPHTLEGALGSLAFAPALALDGGTLSGAPSTLVNVNLPVPAIERAGTIPNTEIERVLRNVG